jgi:hypothetical protein
LSGIVDLNGKGQFLRLEYAERLSVKENSVGFLSDGSDDHLIVVSLNNEVLKDYKIYLYSFKNKPTTNETSWKHSQIYDIEIPKSLNEDIFDYCFVYKTKLFLFNGFQSMTQWNLLTMTFETQYFFNIFDYFLCSYPSNIVINTNQTLIALDIDDRVNIFSMKNGMWISRYG